MKRNLKILIALVIIAAAAFFFLSRKPWNTLKGEIKDFAIKDTAQVTRMFFADKQGNKVLLTRNDQHVWMVNNKFKADPDKIKLMLSTMHDVEVRNPVTDAEHNTVIGILASYGVKSEFYNGDDLIKTIYVGSSTPDQMGTYMLIEGSSVPYATHIAGFVGYLTPRFFAEERLWKTKEIFNLPADEIKQVSVEYPMDIKQSFVIENSTVPLLMSGNNALNCDMNFLKYYLGSFTNLFYEGYSEATQAEMDSVKRITPFCVIKLLKKNGERIKLQVNLKSVGRRTKQQYDEKGNPLPYDYEKYFAFVNDDKAMVVIQDYSFRRLFKKLDDFVSVKPVN